MEYTFGLAEWVCSVCGSDAINYASIQASLGDPKHPLGKCMAHDDKGNLSPLCRPDEFRGKKPRGPKEALPVEMF